MFVVGIWHEIHLCAIATYAGWLNTCIRIQLKPVVLDVMHQNVCIDDVSKPYEMRNLNVIIKKKTKTKKKLRHVTIIYDLILLRSNCRHGWFSQSLRWWMSITHRVSGSLQLWTNNSGLFGKRPKRNSQRYSIIHYWFVSCFANKYTNCA